MPAVVLKNVTKRFGQVTAVDHMDLEIEEGECFSFLGPSGCGKTTTLRLIAGFEDLSEGELYIDGRLMSRQEPGGSLYVPPERRGLGMVFQAFAVWPHLNVFENVAFPLRIRRERGAALRKRVGFALDRTGLSGLEKSLPDELSGGQQQRIALARAIVTSPKVLLLDEPLSNLDPKLRESMRFEIRDLQRQFGFTIIYVTHDQAEAMALSDRMLIMDMGRIEQIGSPLEIYESPASRFVFGFLGDSNFLEVRIDGESVCLADGGALLPVRSPDGWNGDAVMAIRPNEIDIRDGGCSGTVVRKTFSGDVINYGVDIAGQVVTVQTERNVRLEVDDTCSLDFRRVSWYPAEKRELLAERERRKVL